MRRREKTDDGRKLTLSPGAVVVPNVRLTRQIAEGGMGAVWEADHLALHTTVAVKFVLAELGDNDEAVARFEREATAAARIKSPHVVQVLDHGVTKKDGVPYIVMELLEGEDLEARLEREPTLPLELVAHIVQQSAKALTRAHDLAIVHRDIKPSNVFLTEVGGDTFVKLLDFGIARLSMADVGRARVTQTGAMLGTPVFMSPEQMTHAKDVGPGADLWSLGVVAYLALTGQLPFDEETIAGIAMAIERGVFPAATSYVPGLPPTIDKWFTKCFKKDPALRFASAREMADAIGRIAELPVPPAAVSHQSHPPPASRSVVAAAPEPEPMPDEETEDDEILSHDDAPTYIEGKKRANLPGPKTPVARPMARLLDMGDTGVLLPRVTLEEAERAAELEKVDLERGAREADGPSSDAPDSAPKKKGPTTAMGVSGATTEETSAESRGSRRGLYVALLLGLLVASAAAYAIANKSVSWGASSAPPIEPSSETEPPALSDAANQVLSAAPEPSVVRASSSAVPSGAPSAAASAAPSAKPSAAVAPVTTPPPPAPQPRPVSPPVTATPTPAPVMTAPPRPLATAAPEPTLPP